MDAEQPAGSGENFQLFNLETMSGVTPGTRTPIMQRVRLRRLGAPPDERFTWARLLWTGEDDGEDAPGAPARADELLLYLQVGDEPNRWQAAPLVRIPAPRSLDLNSVLARALADAGWQLYTCGSCARWQPAAAATPDGLAVGECRWRSAAPQTPPPPFALAVQSHLALNCAHWQPAAGSAAPLPAGGAGSSATVAPLPKRAELPDAPSGLLARLARLLRPAPPPPPEPTWEQRLLERSGVGAGTEPCFACQGRIANLGALTVESPEGDKQTYSVWRCRACYTTYVNNWIDRWERLDSLETEEVYYRIAPSEAVEALAVIDGVVGGEHPAGRHTRGEQRAWFERFLAGRIALSHQIRQGR